jgi:hypothetical protein
MKTAKIKETVAAGLASILLSLSIRKPSGKTKEFLKKVTKKLSKHLKSDVKKTGQRKVKKSKSPKVVRANTTTASNPRRKRK